MSRAIKPSRFAALLDEATTILRKAHRHRHSLEGTGYYAKRFWEKLGHLRAEGEAVVADLERRGLDSEGEKLRKIVDALFSAANPGPELARARVAWSSTIEPSLISGARPSKAPKVFFPPELRSEVPGHLRTVFDQVQGCYTYEFRDAALVMLRKAVESLIIEGYERASRSAEIKDNSGYLPFSDLVGKAKSGSLFRLSRDSRGTIDEVKKLGDNAAHNPKFHAHRSDLENIRPGTRVLLQDLLKNLPPSTSAGNSS